jgi:hypothetical protein
MYTRSSLSFISAHFPASDPRELFCTLILKGRNHEIKALHGICAPGFVDPRVEPLWRELLGAPFSKRRFGALVYAIKTVEQLWSASGSSLAPSTQAVRSLTDALLRKVAHCIDGRILEDQDCDDLVEQLGRLCLYNALYGDAEEGRDQAALSMTELFPADVTSDPLLLQALVAAGRRVENMNRRRNAELASAATDVVKRFLAYRGVGDGEPPPGPRARMAAVQEAVAGLRDNARRKESLVQSGYSPALWAQEDISVTVRTAGGTDLEAAFQRSLAELLAGYAELLESLGVECMTVGGVEMAVREVFKPPGLHEERVLAVEELRGRRAQAVALIDRRLSAALGPELGPDNCRQHAEKMALLEKEDLLDAQLERDQERAGAAARRSRVLVARLNHRFFDTARCCDEGIQGCYGPQRTRCEKPLEIGLRADAAMLSICDESGVEIENAELLLTREGLYTYKAYTNGHNLDTSTAWASIIVTLVQNGLVPGFIVPHGFPNMRTYGYLRSYLATEPTSAMITYDFDFFGDASSYFDFRPEKIRGNQDLLITRLNVGEVVLPGGFKRSSSFSSVATGAPTTVRLKADLTGTLSQLVQQRLAASEALRPLRVLGRPLTQYIARIVSDGEADVGILELGFDLERWNRGKPSKGATATATRMAPEEKAAALEALGAAVAEVMEEFLEDFDAAGALRDRTRRALVFELRDCLTKAVAPVGGEAKQALAPAAARQHLRRLEDTIRGELSLWPIDGFKRSLAEGVMSWIFKNEDRVWRNRGGRPGHETLQEFLSFLGPQEPREPQPQPEEGAPVPHKPLPGFVLCPSAREGGGAFQPGDILGYAIGEYASGDTYEIIAAWVHPRLKGMGYARLLYERIFMSVKSPEVAFDAIVGGMDRLAASSTALSAAMALGLHRMVS